VDLPDVLARSRPLVLNEMRAVVGERAPPLHDMVCYALGWTEADGGPRSDPAGKGIRPALCLLAAEAVDPSDDARRRALPGAAAVEFVHNFSLVHDDIQDGDVERHHRPTVWAQWGQAQAINVGDALRELAQVALARAAQAGATPDAVLAATAMLNRCALDMIEGQYLDLDYETRAVVSLDDYLTMVERKTGAMLGGSLALGALLATGDLDVAARLERAGRCLGLAFQIRDDALGIWGDSAATGKSSDNDIRRRKKSYPIVYALHQAGPDERALLTRVYSQSEVGDDEVRAVTRELDAIDARGASERAADVHYQDFLEALDGCALPPQGRAALEQAGRFVVRREH
jgi:geranylgeranyl diphosphate synthase type I